MRAIKLSDLLSATLQTKKVAAALNPGEKRNTITDSHLQPLTQRHRNTTRCAVLFVSAVDIHNVVPYSQCYGCAPRSFDVDVNAVGTPGRKAVASDCDR